MRTKSIIFLCFLLFSSVYMISCGDSEPDPVTCDDVDATYDGDIGTLLSGCSNSNCHGGTNTDIPEESRNFTTFAGLNTVISSGSLVQRVITDQTMPPSGALSQSQLDLLQCWADAGYPEN